MKKLLLSCAAGVLCGFGAMATPIVVDFATAEGLPSNDASAEVETAVINGVDLSFFHCKKGTYSGASYLQVSGKNYNGEDAAYVEFKAPENVSSFKVHTGGNASVNVTVGLTCNGVEVSDYSSVKLSEKDADFEFVIPADMQASGTVYRLTTTNKYNAQFSSITLNPEGTTQEPEPIPEPSEVVALDVANAADIQGELIEEEPKTDTSNGSAQHFQPLESLEIDGYMFTFSQGTHTTSAPAYYWPMSTNPDGKKSIRVYKGNTMTITAPAGVTFNSLVAVPDNSNTETEIYKGTAVNTYTFTATATTRINVLKVGLASGEAPVSDVIFENTFENDLNGFDVANLIDNDYKGWKLNSNPKCAIANSYVGGTNLEAESWLTTIVDLTGRKECSFSFEQGFGYTFPEEQVDNYTVLVRNPDVNTEAWTNLEITNYPEKPASGNWTREWALNTFDISEFDGQKIEISLVYKTDGSASRAWEVKNFVVKGKMISAAVEGMVSEDATVHYYTLQGVKVVNPTHGMYIRVQNGKSKKIMVK